MKKDKLLILAILVIGLLIRIWRIDLPLLEFYPTRQVQTAEITRNLYLEDFNPLKPKVHFYGPGEGIFLLEFPLYNLPIALFYDISNSPQEYFGRLFSIFAWTLSAIIIYKIAQDYIGKTASLAAVFIYTFSPLSVLTSRSFQPDQWMLTLSLAAIFFIDKWTSSPKEVFFYVGSFFTALAILVKAPALLFTLIPIWLIIWSFNKLNLLRLFTLTVIAVVPSIIWYLYAASLAKESGLINAFTINNWFRAGLFLDPQYYGSLFGYEYNLGLLPIGILLFLIGLLVRPKRKQAILYFWLLGVAIYFVIFNRHNMVHEYYHLPFIPIAAIFAGIGAERIVANLKNMLIGKNLMFGFLAAFYVVSSMIIISNKGYNLIPRFAHVLETAGAIRELTRPNDLIIGSMDAGPTLVYYSNRTGWDFDSSSKDSVERLEKLKGEGAIIFASANKDQLLENKEFSKYMYHNYDILKETGDYIIFGLTSYLD